MDKKKAALLVVLILALAGALVFLYGDFDSVEDIDEPTEEEMVDDASEEVQFSEDGRVVSYQGRAGETALEVLESLAELEESDGFVTSIGGVEAADDEFWGFYVNGEMAEEGAATFMTDDSDEIEWRLEEIE